MSTSVVPPGEPHAQLQARLARSNAEARPRPKAAGRRLSGMRVPAAAVTAIAVLLLGVISVFADGGTVDVKVTDSAGYAVGTTTDGAIVEYIGKDNEDFGSSGTGVINSFLQTQNNPFEAGYNTNGTREFDTGSSPTFNRAILVSQIPVVPCVSIDESETTPGFCWELFSDINDSNANDPSAAQIQLTELEIWLTANANITGYVQAGDAGFPAGADKVYDFEGNVLIRDVNSGSGRGDLRYLVPLSGITLPANCDYGNAGCATYFVVYTEWGDPEDGEYKSDSGFEEWTVKKYPYLSVTKTANTTYTRTFPWTIDKGVTPASWALFDGDTGTSDYTVTLTKGSPVDSAWAVSGTITIDNPSDQDAPIASVEDAISGVGNVTVDCPVSFPYTLPDGDDLICTYSSPLPNGDGRTNTATVTLQTGPVFTGDADVTFGSPTTLVNDTVHVDDTYAGGPQDQAFNASGEATYSRTFACGADEGTHDNTATITETGQSDDASVTVACYDLSVSKTADESQTRTWEWTIDKSVDPATWDLFTGDTGTSEYTVTVTKTGYTDSDFHVEGDITIHNNHPTMAADLTQVTDSISGFGSVTVDCPALTVPAAGDLVCTYEADLPDGTARTNTATATQQNYDYDSSGGPSDGGTTDYQGPADIDFTGVTPTEVNATIHVSDTYAGGPQSMAFSDSGSTTYTRQFACDDDEGQTDNTASIDETGQSDDASVQVNCYQLTVNKDADESYTRTYEWTIDKSADQDALELMPGVTFTVNYSVTVDIAGSTDSDYAVEGDITISNPHPSLDADLTGVTDEIFDGITATVNCPSLTVPSGGDLVCTYSSDLPDGTTRLNTATATQQNYDYDEDLVASAGGTTDYEGTTNIEFGGPTDLVDECVDVNDTLAGFLGTVCADDVPPPPTTFEYPLDLGPYTEADCGDFDVPNTADFLTNDTAATGEDGWSVHITIPCPEGCTLTLGYWKTHNPSFWGGAPADPNWLLIGPLGEDTPFFDTGDTWFEVFWTNPAGRPYYQLAHQWMAAYLNTLSIQAIGGSIPANVQDALDQGALLLDEYDGTPNPDKNPDLKGKDAKSIRGEFTYYAGILGDFNEGTIGPGHCDEPIQISGIVFTLPIGLAIPIAAYYRRRRRAK